MLIFHVVDLNHRNVITIMMHLAFAIFSNKGERLLTDGDNGDKFIFQNKTGFSKEHILDDDDEWLIYWQPVGKGELGDCGGTRIGIPRRVGQ